MRIAICDDIKEYRTLIHCYTKEFFNERKVDINIIEFSNGQSLLLYTENIDILFLDIELGDANGIEIAKKVQERNANTIILIITSHHEYLDEAMDINVTRYIDKPISQERVFSSLTKATEILDNKLINIHTLDNQIIRLNISQIVFAEAKLKKVTIYTFGGSFNIKEPLKEIRFILPNTLFATPHNSYIVNLNYISSYCKNELLLVYPYEKERIPVSTRKQSEFKKVFLRFIGEGE